MTVEDTSRAFTESKKIIRAPLACKAAINSRLGLNPSRGQTTKTVLDSRSGSLYQCPKLGSGPEKASRPIKNARSIPASVRARNACMVSAVKFGRLLLKASSSSSVLTVTASTRSPNSPEICSAPIWLIARRSG